MAIAQHSDSVRKAFRDGYKAGEKAGLAEIGDGVEVALQKWEAQHRHLFDSSMDLGIRIADVQKALDSIKQQKSLTVATEVAAVRQKTDEDES